MALLKLTRENFDTIIHGNPLVLVDFWAESCAPCHVFAKVYQTVAEKYPEIIFGKVNIEEEVELAKDFKVLTIPLLMIFRGEIAVYAESGVLSASVLEEVILKARALDLSAIQKAIAEAKLNDIPEG